MGLRIGRLLGAGCVIGTSTHPARRAELTDYGAHHAVDTQDPDWPEQVRALTEGRGVDLVIDQLSGDTVNATMAACAIGARIVNVGRLAGMHGDFDFDLHALKRLQYIGVTFRTRTPAEVQAVLERMRAELWPAVCERRLSLPIAARFRFDEAAAAYEMMAANRHFGKIVVWGP
jgi:NADPH2:quinone reductase